MFSSIARRTFNTAVRSNTAAVRSIHSSRPAFFKGAEKMDTEPADTSKFAKVIKIGDKYYGIPAVKEGDMPTDLQQQVGRRFEELIYELNEQVLFNREPVYAQPGSGTKENPILVPSGDSERVVGFECPKVHQLFWFMLQEGQLAYVPETNCYFKLERINFDD